MRDKEMELLRKRKLLELQRKMFLVDNEKEKSEVKDRALSNHELLEIMFVGRAKEVYDAAWRQFPRLMPDIEGALVADIRLEKMSKRVDGEGLMRYLSSHGLRVHLKNTITISEHGASRSFRQVVEER